jgi:hypothetical protein
MIELTVQQRRAVTEHQEEPLRAVDPDTDTTYVLIREDVYNRVKTLFIGEEESELLDAMYPHVMEVFGRDGWDDPSMDVYNELDPRRSS